MPSLPPTSVTAFVDDTGRLTTAGLRILQSYQDLLKTQFTGSGSPVGVVTASPGSTYLNRAGGAGQTLWVKETGTDASGWVAK